ncbi:DUF4325 domain-containing protein [Patescibacteria group bacterium]|nr:DUF4325 domain-containing protein [Patescibacteria group bacterium]
MNLKDEILNIATKKKEIRAQDIASLFGVSRQYASRVIAELAAGGKLIKIGRTRSVFYVLPEDKPQIGRIKKRLQNKNLKEHEVLFDVRNNFLLTTLKENIKSIFDYSFSEMLNNAIEHSKSKNIEIEIFKENSELVFIINDFGIGVFKNIMQKRKLKSELEAIQDLLKGKTTTEPRAHSGEGIFFTSRAADKFILESFEYKLRIDNKIPDIFIEAQKPSKTGTRVIFHININSEKHLNDIFKKYQTDKDELDFGKTEIKVRLYAMGTIHVSRSQARRILSNLDKFKVIVLDFERVPTIGQAFADEIFRVFKKAHSKIKLKPINMNEAVRFMIERVGK